MKILTYNINGIRAAVAKGLPQWLKTAAPDIVCIQESKAQTDQVPEALISDTGYHAHWHMAERRGYSGVGILSKKAPDRVVYGMGMEKYDREGRVIRADFDDLTVVSVYHPNGSASEERHMFKMQWLNDFSNYAAELKKERPMLVISGDFNIAHRPIDIYDPVRHAASSGFLPEERAWMDGFLDAGFDDTFRHFNQDPDQYTWWTYRAGARQRNMGWRIDYNMTSKDLQSRLAGAGILPQVKHSDHCPAWLELS